MSDQFQPGPGVPPNAAFPGGGGEPSEEQMRAMVEQLRATPAAQLVADVVNLLLQGAQVKLGRNDGRLMIDLVGMVAEHVRGLLDENLDRQLGQTVQQLRLAQVEAEQQVVQAAQQGHAEQNDLSRRPPAPGQPREEATEPTGDGGDASAPGADDAPPPPASGGGSKLWVPGG